MESQICENTPGGRGAASPVIPDLEPSFRRNISPCGYERLMLAADGENAALYFQSFAHCPSSLPAKVALCFDTLAHSSVRNSPEMIIMHHALGVFSLPAVPKSGRIPALPAGPAPVGPTPVGPEVDPPLRLPLS